ncbi:RNA-binding protein [Pedobacter kyungheensis]|uniref:RNA recognition motif. (A.k.a. RRM, RBD, or RNP domain) n=2 Tax=Pedobacter TaxID=84567 RepID=A0A1G6Y2P5_9SPHI|nr:MULTISPECIES: RNA-binding protein [Pedobacter]KIA96863.1 RNA-binding protein [Pedobacter kyungheensis]SDD84668.1 RNA recognition motif. (a.k.a. RRM, RBD, or RNP domain) [Pedobacter soli]
MVKIFIGGLPDNIQEMDLAIFVSLHGRVETIKVVRDRATGKCKGYAFLEIFSLPDAKNIVSTLNGESFKGNIITVKISEEENKTQAFKPKANQPFKAKRPRLQR